MLVDIKMIFHATVSKVFDNFSELPITNKNKKIKKFSNHKNTWSRVARSARMDIPKALWSEEEKQEFDMNEIRWPIWKGKQEKIQ